MAHTLTITLGDHGVVSESAVLTGVRAALVAAVPSGNFLISLIRESTELLRLLRLVVEIRDALGSAAFDSLGSAIARVPGVASVAGEGFFYAGPSFGRTAVVDTSDQIVDLQSQMGAVVDQLNLLAKQIQFIGEPFNPAGGALAQDVPVQVCDADGKLVGLYPPTSVTVRITGGTAAGALLNWNGQSDGTSLVVDLSGGKATVNVTATGVGTVDLDLVDSASTGLLVIDTATITFS